MTIEGDGSLKAQGGSEGAGIGGSRKATGIYGNITINGGNITAIGGSGAAGIGSGTHPNTGTSLGSYNPNYNERWGTITICGGKIEATGGSNAAGIGGASHTSSGEIIINGGTVKASGDSGIGSGLGSNTGDDKGPGYYYANVTINGGDITAYATNNMGAGIGGGMYGDAYVIINGGKINASVNTNGKAYQGGAGIGGGYQGTAVININGGDITATGGNGSPGIGNGALGASTTTEKYIDDQWTGTKTVRTPGATIKENESVVNISGGTVKAYGGVHGAGIGSGNAGEWCNVNISGGDVYAVGGKSTEKEMAGGAGIGSGVKYAPSKKAYSKETDVKISITGGTVKAIAGWGAAAIGSGAGNKTAETIAIDANKASIEAYADGTKFAIDTRNVKEDGTTTSITQGREIYGNILQGTFVHKGVIGDYQQNPEGLDPIILTNDKTNQTRTLTGIPEGYRSFATSVTEAGTYTIYTDDSDIGKGEGRYFARTAKDVYDEDEILEKGVKYSVSAGKISDNFYLYPVKSVVIEKNVVTTGSLEKETINQTVNFALWDDQAKDYIRNKNGDIWIESIEIVAGKAQGKAYFINIEDKTYGIWEVNEDGSNPKGTKYNDYQLTDITTSHGNSDDNDAQINDEIWTDKVIVNNTYSPLEETIPETKPEETKPEETKPQSAPESQTSSDSDPKPGSNTSSNTSSNTNSNTSSNSVPQSNTNSVTQQGSDLIPQAPLLIPNPTPNPVNPAPIVDDEPVPVEEIAETEVPLVDLEVIENTPIPLSEGVDEHTCCLLHFILMALTLLVTCIYTKRRKDVQKDIDEKQDELLKLCKDLGILEKLIKRYPEYKVEDIIKEVMENDELAQ